VTPAFGNKAAQSLPAANQGSWLSYSGPDVLGRKPSLVDPQLTSTASPDCKQQSHAMGAQN
jgi:hypothetical protein